MIEFEMDGILAVRNVATILGLEFVCFLPDNLRDLVGTLPSKTKLASSWVFSVLVDSASHLISSLECPSSGVLVAVPCHLLVVAAVRRLAMSLNSSMVSRL